jgi:hypothetical protein
MRCLPSRSNQILNSIILLLLLMKLRDDFTFIRICIVLIVYVKLSPVTSLNVLSASKEYKCTIIRPWDSYDRKLR